MVSLEQWWTKDAVFLFGKGRSANRRQVVLDAANKDGGAHVDAQLSERYQDLLAGAGMTMRATLEDGQFVSNGPDYAPHAALRQMGYEILHSPDLRRLCRNRL